jgi:phosphoserine aminotransferase
MNMRPYNFAPGPAQLPEPVLQAVQAETMSYRGTGVSVMEMSHRSPEFEDIIDRAEKRLRELLGVPDSWVVLFLQGGASLQFSMVPMNLYTARRTADYVCSGHWAQRAIEEAARLGTARVVASSQAEGFVRVPEVDPANLDPQADYLHVTWNNTIYGTRSVSCPAAGSVPVVADMSSSLLSEPVEVSRFGLIYAAAQKNIGPAGLTVVIVRKDLLERAGKDLPAMLSYRTHAKGRSLYNTPPCHAVYVAGLVLDWIAETGGLAAMEARNKGKAEALYAFLDSSRLFRARVTGPDRSLMNVTFGLPTPELEKHFVVEAERAGLLSLAGHRTAGGMRASLYNAMPLEGVMALVAFMAGFEKENR